MTPAKETTAEARFPEYPGEGVMEEAVAATGAPALRVYRPETVQVVLGRGSVPGREVDLEACRAEGVPVYKRRGGGCAVVLDPGCVVVSLVLPLGGFRNNRALFRRFTSWLIRGLEHTGISGVELRGVSDLALEDRKVGGACLHRTQKVCSYGVSLLAAPDVERVERLLPHPPREPAWRHGRPHREFMGALIPRAWSGTVEALGDSLARVLDPVEGFYP